jgi:hypothetical protein
MKELHELMTQRLQAAMDNGTIQTIIDKRVNEAIDDMVKDVLRSYSDTGKALKEKVSVALMGNIQKITFPEYNHFLVKQISEQYANVLQEQYVAKFTEQLDEIVKPVPETMTGREFMAALAEILYEDIQEAGGEIELKWDSRDKSIYLNIPYSYGKLTVTFYNFLSNAPNGWSIGYLSNDSQCLSHGISNNTHANHSLEQWLYKLYCTKTSIIGLADHEGEDLDADY